MKLACTFTLLALLLTLRAHSQEKLQGGISGYVQDSATQQGLASATVRLRGGQDTTFTTLITTNPDGHFRFRNLPPGRYRLQISYMGYQTFIQHILLDPQHKDTDLGRLLLQRTGVQLRSVEIVKKRPPVNVKKDTLEFNAEYFTTRPDGYIEELLKKIPGIQIAKDGTITVNGQVVDQLLIDGIPFFSGDPKMATRNLNALMVDKVQLIDAVSELARFTGTGNGRKEKQLNIIIKKEFKKAPVGSITGGYGTGERFAAKGNLNRFGDQQRISLIGSADNVNGYYDNAATPAPAGGGITRNWQTGINYNETVSPSLKLMGNYTVNSTHNTRQSTNARQNIFPDTSYYYNQQLNETGDQTDHQLFLRMDYKKDTQYILIAAAQLNYNTYERTLGNQYATLDRYKSLVNQGNINNLNTGNTPKLSAAVSFGRNFHKKGRAIGAQFSFDNSHQHQEQFNSSYNTFMLANGDKMTDTVQQKINNGITDQQTYFSINYAEPLFSNNILNINYGVIYLKSHSNKDAYDYDPANGSYNILNNDLSSQFESTITNHFFSAGLRKETPKYIYSIGGTVQSSQLNNLNEFTHNQVTLAVTKPLLQLSFNYFFNARSKLNVFYNNNLEQPGITQLQPVPDNSNPLYVQSGNPDLQPAYTHNLMLEYNTMNPQTMRIFNLRLKTQVINNKIVNSTWLDTLGRQVSQPLNASGAHNITLTVNNTFPIKAIHSFINSSTELTYARDISYMNSVKGSTNNYNITQALGFNYSVNELLDLSLDAGLNYTNTRYSLLAANSSSYCSYTLALAGLVHLPLGFMVSGKANYRGITGLAAGYDQGGLLLNVAIAKNVGKRSTARLQVFDLLKQNRGITRNIGPNYLEDSRSNTLQRFFMIGYTWQIRKKDAE